AGADALSTQLLNGELAADRAAVAPTLIFNQRLDGWLTVLFLIIMWVVMVEMLRISVRFLAGKPVPPSSETPYVATRLDASALPRSHWPMAAPRGNPVRQFLSSGLSLLRGVTGDDAYEKYLAHMRA